MGPSGSGKSTLMHCLAGLDSATSGQVFIGDTDLTTLGDDDLTRLRRDQRRLRLPGVQPACRPSRRWRTSRCRWTSPGASPTRSGSTTVIDTVGLRDRLAHRPSRALRRAAAAGRRGAGAGLPAGRHLRRRADRQPRLALRRRGARASCAAASTTSARPSSWSRTTRTPPSYADRVLFLADGRIVDEMHDPTADTRARADEALRRRPAGRQRSRRPDVLRATLRSAAGAQAAAAAVRGSPSSSASRSSSGTLVFTDTLKKTFDDLFTQTTTDVAVTPRTEFTAADELRRRARPPRCRPVGAGHRPRGGRRGQGRGRGLRRRRGHRRQRRQGRSARRARPRSGRTGATTPSCRRSGWSSGRGPTRSGEVAIDSQSADKGGLTVGDTVTLLTPGPRIQATSRRDLPLRHHRATWPAPRSPPSTRPPPSSCCCSRAQLHRRSTSRPSPASPRTPSPPRIRAVLAGRRHGGQDRPAGQPTRAPSRSATGCGSSTSSCSCSPCVALFVGTFIILNTFSMLVAQRTRELALLRAVGATRRQVRGSVLVEAAVVGTLGGVTGLLLGSAAGPRAARAVQASSAWTSPAVGSC